MDRVYGASTVQLSVQDRGASGTIEAFVGLVAIMLQ